MTVPGTLGTSRFSGSLQSRLGFQQSTLLQQGGYRSEVQDGDWALLAIR